LGGNPTSYHGELAGPLNVEVYLRIVSKEVLVTFAVRSALLKHGIPNQESTTSPNVPKGTQIVDGNRESMP